MQSILTKIAWRNIWRNPRRSWILILAIATGVFCFLGSMSFMDGFSLQMVDQSIRMQGGHIQLAGKGYLKNPTVRTRIVDAQEASTITGALQGVSSAPGIVTQGMINSAEQASGVQIYGIDPIAEARVSSIAASIIEGDYLEEDMDRNVVLIGQALAEKLNVLPGEKIVLMVNDLNNQVQAGAYRIVGLFSTSNPAYDKSRIYLHLEEARRLVSYGEHALSTISIRLEPGTDQDLVVNELRSRVDTAHVEVLPWQERAPLLTMMRELYDVSSLIFAVILFTAIAFTIINSFLMVIFERIREFGIMSANGVKPAQIRRMLFLEALFICILGIGIGATLASVLIWRWSQNGLDLSAFSEGIGSFGAGTVIYPFVDWGHILTGFSVILVIVLLAVLYPAFKAGRFKPVDALRHV